MTLVSSCPMCFLRPFDLTTLCPKTFSSFASSKVACELHQHLTVKPGGWNSTHSHLGLRDIQPCPVFLSLFSNQFHKAKSLKKKKEKKKVIVILSSPLNLQVLFGASKKEHITCIQASLRPQIPSARSSLRKYKTLI